MKTTNKKAFLALLSILTCIIMPLKAMNKKKGKKGGKTDDFEKILQRNAQIIEKNKIRDKETQELLKNKQQLKENLRFAAEQDLCGQYKFFNEFKRSVKNWNPCDKNILQDYSNWLEKIKTLFLNQDAALDSMLEYATHFSQSKAIKDTVKKALGDYIDFNDHTKSYKIRIIVDPDTNDFHDIVFGLRYQALMEGGEMNLNLPQDEKLFLEDAAVNNNNKKLQWWAHATLATTQFMLHEKKGTSLGKKNKQCLIASQEITPTIKELNLSQTTVRILSKCLSDMIDVKNHNYTQQEQGINTDAEMYVAIKDLHQKALENKNSMFKVIDGELAKLEKLIAPTALQQNTKPIINKNTTTTLKHTEPTHHAPDIGNEISIGSQKNNALPQICLLKTINEQAPTQESPYIRTIPTKLMPFYGEVLNRVNRWHDDPEAALKSIQLDISDAYSKFIIKAHAFSKAVDYFIEPLAIKCSWQAQGAQEGSLSYNIPGQIIDHNTNKTTTGVFSYGVNKDGSLFHRCFSKRAYDKISDDIKKQVYDGQFPDLTDEQTLKKQTRLRSVKGLKDCKDVIQENNFCVEIEDKKNNMTLRLFKVKQNK